MRSILAIVIATLIGFAAPAARAATEPTFY